MVYHLWKEREGEAMLKRGLRKYKERVGADVRVKVLDVTNNIATLDLERLAMHDTIVEGDTTEWHLTRLNIPPHTVIAITPGGRLRYGDVMEDDSLRNVSRELSATSAGSKVHLFSDPKLVADFVRTIFPLVRKHYVHNDMEWVDSINVENAVSRSEEMRNVAGQKDQKVKIVRNKVSEEGAKRYYATLADSVGQRLLHLTVDRNVEGSGHSLGKNILKRKLYKLEDESNTDFTIRLRDGLPLLIETSGTDSHGETHWTGREVITLTAEH